MRITPIKGPPPAALSGEGDHGKIVDLAQAALGTLHQIERDLRQALIAYKDFRSHTEQLGDMKHHSSLIKNFVESTKDFDAGMSNLNKLNDLRAQLQTMIQNFS